MIDHLHLRYKSSGTADTRLQKELKVKLMGPEPGTAASEKLVNIIAKKMSTKHSFISAKGAMGAAITNSRSKQYELPFSFEL